MGRRVWISRVELIRLVCNRCFSVLGCWFLNSLNVFWVWLSIRMDGGVLVCWIVVSRCEWFSDVDRLVIMVCMCFIGSFVVRVVR